MKAVSEYRACGTSGLHLSVIGLGCWSFGGGQYWGPQDQGDVNAVVRTAVDCGINYFDTAEAYNDGRSEAALGIALQGLKRDEVVIGSKITPANCYPGQIEAHCEASLKRLKTDYLDVYMLHWPIHPHSIRHYTKDPVILANPPSAAETFAVLEKLRQTGKIRHVGISNFSRTRIDADIPANVAIAVNQLPYNLLCRAIEFDAAACCEQKGIGIISYMTLLQGVLADAYPDLVGVPEMRRRTRHFDSAGAASCRHGEPGFEAETIAALAAIREIAAQAGLTMADLATRWTVANRHISCALIGARNVKQLMANVQAVQEPLDAALIERLNEATRTLRDRMGNHFDYYESAANDRTL
jgi:aryl-alcohol dehydrogenase-like predicted oxidoreductase